MFNFLIIINKNKVKYPNRFNWDVSIKTLDYRITCVLWIFCINLSCCTVKKRCFLNSCSVYFIFFYGLEPWKSLGHTSSQFRFFGYHQKIWMRHNFSAPLGLHPGAVALRAHSLPSHWIMLKWLKSRSRI